MEKLCVTICFELLIKFVGFLIDQEYEKKDKGTVFLRLKNKIDKTPIRNIAINTYENGGLGALYITIVTWYCFLL